MRVPPLLALLLLPLLPPAVLSPAHGLTVSVDPAGGAPRLLVNGKPVRGRMFWGGPGSAPIHLKSTAEERSFEFEARDHAENGTWHFRFGKKAGSLVLDDLQVVDLATGKPVLPLCTFEDGPDRLARDWQVWPPGEANTTGKIALVPGAGRNGSTGLRIELTNPPAGKEWPDFHLYHQANLPLAAGHCYRASFWVRTEDERELLTAFYRPGPSYLHLGGPESPFESQIRLAAAAGVDFVSFPIATPWPEPGKEPDWSGVDAECRRVLRANPKALLLPRIGMNPPAWWMAAHPDEVMRWEDGPNHRSLAVVASPLYLRDAAERLSGLVRHLEEAFGEHVAGYHPVGQNTGEWFYEDTWRHPLNGYAPADLAAWRLWLQTRYANDAALQQAWQSGETLAAATVPTPAERHAAPDGPLHDPQKRRRLLDWAEFQQEAMARCVRALAQATRRASAGRKLVVFFYGYVFEFAAVQTGPAVSGHYALRQVLDCPDIDVLCSPISYFDRGLGQSAPSMTAAESVALAGKLWLNEDDTHTYLATGTPPGAAQHVDTLEESNAELVRNTAQEALRNFATWWMDLGSSGWFNDPGMWEQMKRLRPLDEELLQHPLPFRPEIAVVIDERAMLRVAERGNSITRPGIYEIRRALGRLGAPYGQYLLDDVAAGRVQAKLFLVLNPWDLDPADRTRLQTAAPGSRWLWLEPQQVQAGVKPETLRAAAREAGVHLFTQGDCNVWANGPFISLHASQDGPVELDTAGPGPIQDLLSGAILGQGPRLTLPMKLGETRVLRAGASQR